MLWFSQAIRLSHKSHQARFQGVDLFLFDRCGMKDFCVTSNTTRAQSCSHCHVIDLYAFSVIKPESAPANQGYIAPR